MHISTVIIAAFWSWHIRFRICFWQCVSQ